MNQVKQLHAHTLRHGTTNQYKTLIEKLIQLQNVTYAQNLFDKIPEPTVYLYNRLIQAYSCQNQPYQCLSLYYQMCLNNYPPNQHTFTALFAASASLPSPFDGQRLHAHFVKMGFCCDVYASTALVDMYGKMGLVELSRKVFDEMPVRNLPTWNSLIAGYSRGGDMSSALEVFTVMPERNVVSWTTIISGFTQNGLYGRALGMYLRMEKEVSIRPNEITMASALPACANVGALEVGKRIEVHARQNGLMKNLYVSNALLEMYAKCGKIDEARRVFDEIGEKRNSCSWNSMIMGYAVHGLSNEALQAYDQMLREGIVPDDVTFVALLQACIHGGMVSKGRELSQSMKEQFRIVPKLEHYGCMVDLLGRAGKLHEAYELILSMPMKPDSIIWGALLGSCSFHSNVEIAEIAAEALFELEPCNPGNYVILSNIYASANRWDGVARLRMRMKGGQIVKAAGYSLVELGDEVHKFIVEDLSHPRWNEIRAVLNGITRKMKMWKYNNHFNSEFDELFLTDCEF